MQATHRNYTAAPAGVKRSFAEAWLRPDDPGEFVLPFEALAPGTTVAAVLRVSSREQHHHLQGQRQGMLPLIVGAGLNLAAVFAHEWSGKLPGWLFHLQDDARKAQALGATALVFATPDRILRAGAYRSDDEALCRLKPALNEWDQIVAAVAPLKLVTWVALDTSDADCRSILVRWGGMVSDRAPGYKIRYQARMRPVVLHLGARGYSHRAVSAMTGVKPSAVYQWLKRPRE